MNILPDNQYFVPDLNILNKRGSNMEMQTKYFTPVEAKRTLPLVKQIVKDILDSAREMRLLVEDIGDHAEKDSRVLKMMEDINGFLKEIEELGCYYKDWNFSMGLVDFPSVINGKEVLLCWRSDEEEITYYHEPEAGYQGRKLIPEEYLLQ